MSNTVPQKIYDVKCNCNEKFCPCVHVFFFVFFVYVVSVYNNNAYKLSEDGRPMIRPRYAGQLYAQEYVQLMKQLDASYQHDLGPGDLPTRRTEESILGVIVPHSHVELSGACAAWAYKMVAEHALPKTFVVLVPDHSGSFVNYATVLEDFETAFGVLKVDKELAEALIADGIVSRTSSLSEPALEVQLPFLQHACKDRLHDLRILPLVVPHSHNAEALAARLLELRNDVVVLVASNFTRFGPKFVYQPFRYNIEESLNNLDMSLVRFLSQGDVQGFLKYVKKHKVQVSAPHAVAVGLTLLSQLGVSEGELLSYYKSSALLDDQENTVSFMSQ